MKKEVREKLEQAMSRAERIAIQTAPPTRMDIRNIADDIRAALVQAKSKKGT